MDTIRYFKEQGMEDPMFWRWDGRQMQVYTAEGRWMDSIFVSPRDLNSDTGSEDPDYAIETDALGTPL